MSELRIVRFKTGEDVLAEVQTKVDCVKLLNPFVVRIVALKPEQQEQKEDIKQEVRYDLRLIPYILPYCEEDYMEVSKSDVRCYFTPIKELVQRYTETFNRIVVPETLIQKP